MPTEVAFALQDQLELCRELARLIRAKQPLDEGLAEIAQTRRGSRAALAESVRAKLESGQSLSDSLTGRRISREATILAGTIDAGLAGGDLGEALESWSRIYLSLARYRMRMRAAMWYPMSLVVLMFACIGFTAWTLIPQFEESYQTLVRHVPDWFAWLRWVHQNLVVLIAVTSAPLLLWPVWSRLAARRLDRHHLPVQPAVRMLFQAHAAQLAARLVVAGQPVANIRKMLVSALGAVSTESSTAESAASQSDAAPPTRALTGKSSSENFTAIEASEILGRETNLALSALELEQVSAQEASSLLKDVAEQLTLRSDAVALRRARRFPMIISAIVGIAALTTYVLLIYLPWLTLFHSLSDGVPIDS